MGIVSALTECDISDYNFINVSKVCRACKPIYKYGTNNICGILGILGHGVHGIIGHGILGVHGILGHGILGILGILGIHGVPGMLVCRLS